jgi:hypothetical protein
MMVERESALPSSVDVMICFLDVLALPEFARIAATPRTKRQSVRAL